MGDDEIVSPSTMNNWGQWAQNQAGSLIGGALNMWQYRTIAQSGGVPAVSSTGQVFTEGKRIPSVTLGTNGVTISPMVLIVGAVLLFVIAKK